jgi:hypothetical protein
MDSLVNIEGKVWKGTPGFRDSIPGTFFSSVQHPRDSGHPVGTASHFLRFLQPGVSTNSSPLFRVWDYAKLPS